MSYEYPRFKEWADKNYPPEEYFSAEDRLSDIETRMNGDGRPMPEKLRQSLLGEFQSYYDPIIQEMRQRQEDAQRAADLLGSGKIPQSLSDEMLERAESPEFLGIDFAQFQTTREDVYPPEIKKFVRSQSFFSKIASGFKRLFRWGK